MSTDCAGFGFSQRMIMQSAKHIIVLVFLPVCIFCSFQKTLFEVLVSVSSTSNSSIYIYIYILM